MTDHAANIAAAKVRLENARAEDARLNDTVDCDVDCSALNDPRSDVEIYEAYRHWRWHPTMGGCSHGW